jgi:hypothetical protein
LSTKIETPSIINRNKNGVENMTTRANLYVDQGVDFAVVLDLFSNEGETFDITTQDFKCEVRKVFSSSLAFEAVVQINTDDEDLNNLDLIISANTTSDIEPGKYQYDIVMINGYQRTKILEGLMFILPTISR